MRNSRFLRIAVLLVLLTSRALAAEPVGRSIDRGLEFLLEDTKQHVLDLRDRYGSRSMPGDRETGRLALQLYGLVVAGVAVSHPTVERGFSLLSKLRFNWTYTTCCYIFALDAAISQLEDDLLMLSPEKVKEKFRDDPRIGRPYRARLEAAVKAIVTSQNGLGAWRYTPNAQDYDNSVTQFAVLALGVGGKRRLPIEREVWRGVVDHFVKGQEESGPTTKKRLTMAPTAESRRDRVEVIAAAGEGPASHEASPESGSNRRGGTTEVAGDAAPPVDPVVGTEHLDLSCRGWNYTDGGAKWSMTCAGLSSLLLARENLRGSISPKANHALNKAIRDGYGWLMHHWSPKSTFYNMYSLEKVGDIGHVLKFGDDDWYKTLETHLIETQSDDGSWTGSGHEEEKPGVATAFALLILNRATSLLSQSPATRIIVSGRSAPPGDLSDRSWVYVPLLDTTLHYPSLLRAIRLRPSPKLIRFLRNIVDNYPEEWKGELIPPLARIQDAVPNRSAQKVIEDYLVDITGYRYRELDSYLQWYRRWLRVVKIAEEGKEERIPELLTYYRRPGKSIPLRRTIIWALTRLKAREALPIFLEDLNHKDAEIRLAAYGSFRSFYLDFPPPFDPNASATVRRDQVAAIKEWYQDQIGR